MAERRGDNSREPLPEETTPVTSGGSYGRREHDTQHGRFLPGTLFGKRYRIVGLLGRGGMGEVYRADDLELGQTVALKLLPRSLATDEGALTLLRNEVRVARDIANPNVCRVYDLGEVDGQYFVSMEYVDGEDLASLLRRIGRVSREKAVDIVAQLAAGMAAAHERGVIHRDLKPANIMLDGRGRVRIMDFGVAGFAEEIKASGGVAGTISYMSPEQLRGQTASMRSDVYSLGLVMYEVIAGRRAYEGRSVDDLRKAEESGPPPSPSSLVSDVDPALEHAILWCLEADPARRPASALAVVSALPCCDPLAAALAAGETPSPEMVAASGGRGGLGLRPGVVMLALTLAGIIVAAALNDKVSLHSFAKPTKAPVVLVDKAREILVKLGYSDRPGYSASGLFTNFYAIQHVATTDSSVGRWEKLRDMRPPAYYFWYRESDGPMVPWNSLGGSVTRDDPPMVVQNMKYVVVDQTGRLAGLEVAPLYISDTSTVRSFVDAELLFSLAELDLNRFEETTPRFNEHIPWDERKAWKGSYPGDGGLPVRVEATYFRGKPVYFRVFDTGRLAWFGEATPQAAGSAATHLTFLSALQRYLYMAVVIGGILVIALAALRNIRLGRADRRTALRLGVFVLLLVGLWKALGVVHYSSFSREMDVVLAILMTAGFGGVSAALAYLAGEPHLRKLWPDCLVSSTRLAIGQWKDPRIGRDILIGTAFGVGSVILYQLAVLIPNISGMPIRQPLSGASLVGGRLALAAFLNPGFITMSFSGGIALLLVLLLVRRKSLALGITFIIYAVTVTDADLSKLSQPAELAVFVADTVGVGLMWVGFAWFGFLAVVAGLVTYQWLLMFPITLDTSAWYAGASTLVLIALAALALYGFGAATAGQSRQKVVGSR